MSQALRRRRDRRRKSWSRPIDLSLRTPPPPGRTATHLCSGAVEDPDGDRYFRPFQLACQNKSAKIKALSLDVIEKMIGESLPAEIRTTG